MKSQNDLITKDLLENESIILKYNNVVMYVNVVNDYHISPPLKTINPLIYRLIDGRNSIYDENWLKNEELFISGFFILTNYRVLFFAKEENFSVFTLPHDLGNSIKNRLYGLISIPLNCITAPHKSSPLLKVIGYKILNIYVRRSNTVARYRFGFYFVNLSELISNIEKYKNHFENENIIPFSTQLCVNQRLEKHNKYWIKATNIIVVITIIIALLNTYLIFSTFLLTSTSLLYFLNIVCQIPLFIIKLFINHD